MKKNPAGLPDYYRNVYKNVYMRKSNLSHVYLRNASENNLQTFAADWPCFICHECIQSDDVTCTFMEAQGFSSHLRSDIFKAVCTFLGVNWKHMENDGLRNGSLPFCGFCTEFAVQLMSLKNQILRTETEIRSIVEDIQLKIQTNELLNVEFKLEDENRILFRRHALREYYAKHLLRVKIHEFNAENEAENHIIEVEPSLIQFNFESSPIKKCKAPPVQHSKLEDEVREWDELAKPSQSRPISNRLRSSRKRQQPRIEPDVIEFLDFNNEVEYEDSIYQDSNFSMTEEDSNSDDSDFEVSTCKVPGVVFRKKPKTEKRATTNRKSSSALTGEICDKAKAVRSNNGGIKLSYKGYEYIMHFTAKRLKERVWCCELKKECVATIRTQLEIPVIGSSVCVLREGESEHTHPPIESERDSLFQTQDPSEESSSQVDLTTCELPRSESRELPSKQKLVKMSGSVVKSSGESRISSHHLPAENFGDVQQTEDGRQLYEGIEIKHRKIGSTVGRKRVTYLLECGECGKEVRPKMGRDIGKGTYRLLMQHIRAAHTDAYKCEHCGLKLRSHELLRRHLRKLHPPGGRKKVPRVFGSSTRPPEIITQHDGKMEFRGIEVRRKDLENGDYVIECGQCEVKFLQFAMTEKRGLRCPYRKVVNHMKRVHFGNRTPAIPCPTCGRMYLSQKSLQRHICERHTTRPKPVYLICDICEKPLLSQRMLSRHKWSHKNEQEKEDAKAFGVKPPLKLSEYLKKRKEEGPPKFQCAECGKQFHFSWEMKRHDVTHRKEKNHQCSYCGKCFTTPQYLDDHVKHVHEKERLHAKHWCNYCDRWFTSKYGKMKHERSHTKTRSPSCPTCQKSFSTEARLLKHIQLKQCDSTRSPTCKPNRSQPPASTSVDDDDQSEESQPRDHLTPMDFGRGISSIHFFPNPRNVPEDSHAVNLHQINTGCLPMGSSPNIDPVQTYLRHFEHPNFLPNRQFNY